MQKKSEKTKNKNPVGLYLLIFLVLVLLFYHQTSQKDWYVTNDGFLVYPSDRGRVEFAASVIQTGEGHIIKKVIYKSSGADIYALLRIPQSEDKVPAVVIAPGAGVLKEHRQDFAGRLAEMGYASIVLDQRTFGETNGTVPPLGQDIESFKSGVEPVQHRLIYDILRAGDVLRAQPEIDPTKIAFIGESMGGRFVIIAGAIDKDSKGVIAMSTGGYGFTDASLWKYGREEANFLKSIDPDNYAGMIAPRRLVVFHYSDDKTVPLEYGRNTFESAQEPKELYVLNGTVHGYNIELDPHIKKELALMLG